MKLNNKGMSVVELILAFALLVIIVLGMYDVIIEAKEYSSQKQVEKDLLEYKNTMIYDIENDLIKLGFNFYNDTSTGTIEKGTITFKDGTSKDISIDLSNKEIKYGNIKYDIPNKTMVQFNDDRVIDISPAQNVSISYDESNKLFIIDIPYFLVDDEVNRGFKIVHPTDL